MKTIQICFLFFINTMVLAQEIPTFKEMKTFCDTTIKNIEGTAHISKKAGKRNTRLPGNIWLIFDKIKRAEYYDLFKIYKQRAKKNKWKRKDKRHIELLIRLGLFEDAHKYAKSLMHIGKPWVRAGQCHMYLSYTSLCMENKEEARNYWFSAKKRLKNFKEKRKRNTLKQTRSLKSRLYDKSKLVKKYFSSQREFIKAIKKDYRNTNSWRIFIGNTNHVDFKLNFIVFLRLFHMLSKKTKGADWILLKLAYTYHSTYQFQKVLFVTKKLKNNPSAYLLRAKAYSKLRKMLKAQQELKMLKNYPSFKNKHAKEIELIEKLVDQRW